MANKSIAHILVLGADGMLGQTVFSYLLSQFPRSTWGTTRKKLSNNKIFFFNAHKISDLEKIYKRINHIDYIINCIGILRDNKNTKEMQFVNEKFPHNLQKFAEKYHCKVIHVSSDAVFSPLEKQTYEDTSPSPADLYGRTKLAGESQSKNVLTVRTSLVGFDATNHKGLLEWVKTTNKKIIPGFTNQKWSGATTLQFAYLCEDIILNNMFKVIRNKTNILHFAPLKPITKYKLLTSFIKITKINKNIVKQKGDTITRFLQSHYVDYFSGTKYTDKIEKALKELL